MNGAEAVLWCICFATAFESCARAEDDAGNLVNFNETLQVDVFRGIKLHVANDRARITVSMSAFLKENEVEQRGDARLKFKKGILQKIGMGMMMMPVVMQLMSLPGTIASIKMSLLRSIFVGKLALAVLFYNMIKNSQKAKEVVIVHKPEYHEHYYHGNEAEDYDSDKWWGR